MPPTQVRKGQNKKRGAAVFLRDLFFYALAVAAFVFLIANGVRNSVYNWQWYRVGKYFWSHGPDGWIMGPLMQGLGLTLFIAGLSLCFALVFGLGAMLAGMGRSRAGRAFARLYVEAIRNTPLVVQLFVIYFVIAPAFEIGQVASAVLALSLFEGAYFAEIFRAGMAAVPRSQWEASASLGMTKAGTFRLVVLPQAVSHVLPPLAGEVVNLVKNTALVSFIAVADLTMRGQVVIADTFLSLEIWLAVAGIYLALTLSLSRLAAYLERRAQSRI